MAEYYSMANLEILDWTLRWFKSSNAQPKATIEELFNALNEVNNRRLTGLFGNIRPDLQRILNRLEKDRNIKPEGEQLFEDGHTSIMYSITLEGLDHINSGGYTAANLQAAQIELQRRTQRDLAMANHRLQQILVYLTAVLAFGTTVAAGYYLIQIYFGSSDSHPCLMWLVLLFAAGLSLPIVLYRIPQDQQEDNTTK